MRITIVTLFPAFFDSPLSTSLVGKAIGTGRLSVAFEDPRDGATDKHRSVDDVPYGGGAGMVMKPDIMAAAIDRARGDGPARVVLLTPQGRRLEQADLSRWAQQGAPLVLVAGRYEGFDERIRTVVDEEISLGDFVLTGGEYAAAVIVDGVARLLPGVLGNDASSGADSFSEGLLEHAQYTRPLAFGGVEVPELLRGGDHAAIAAARRRDALARTRARRPDLLARRGFDAVDRAWLVQAPSAAPPLVVVTHGHADPAREPLDTWLRLTAAYGVVRWVIVPPRGADDGWTEAASARLDAVPTPAALSRPLPRGRTARARAEASRAHAAATWQRARAAVVVGPVPELPEATWLVADPDAGPEAQPVAALRTATLARPWVLELGATERAAPRLPALRVAAPLNTLGAAAAAAILLDRLVGEG